MHCNPTFDNDNPLSYPIQFILNVIQTKTATKPTEATWWNNKTKA